MGIDFYTAESRDKVNFENIALELHEDFFEIIKNLKRRWKRAAIFSKGKKRIY